MGGVDVRLSPAALKRPAGGRRLRRPLHHRRVGFLDGGLRLRMSKKWATHAGPEDDDALPPGAGDPSVATLPNTDRPSLLLEGFGPDVP